MKNCQISTKNIIEGKMLSKLEYEKNFYQYQDEGYFKREIGEYVFLVPKTDNDLGILIQDIAKAYIDFIKKSNVLVLVEDTENSIVFIFADCKSLFEKNSCSLIEVKKDIHFEDNIKQLETFFFYYFEDTKEIDVISNSHDFEILSDLVPTRYTNKLNLLKEKQIEKIIKNTSRIYTKSFLLQKYMLLAISFLVPFFLVGILFNGLMDNKNKRLNDEILSLQGIQDEVVSEIKSLKKNKYFIEDVHYKTLNNKGILR